MILETLACGNDRHQGSYFIKVQDMPPVRKPVSETTGTSDAEGVQSTIFERPSTLGRRSLGRKNKPTPKKRDDLIQHGPRCMIGQLLEIEQQGEQTLDAFLHDLVEDGRFELP
jgi:hypothetical protein